MIVSSNDGNFICNSYEEYELCVEKCFSNKSGNEIWCTHGEKEYPCLSVLVNGEKAVCNYFSDNNEQMFASLGNINEKGVVEFLNGQYDVASYQVIAVDEAMKCVMSFYYSEEKPDCVEWEEL